MKNLTPEMLEKAKAAKTAEELYEIAKANGVEMTADEAATYFAQLNPKSGELDDDDLDNVAGGACDNTIDGTFKIGDTVRVTSGQTCKKCGSNIGTISSKRHTVYVKCSCGESISTVQKCSYEAV